jgi:hypothetical protein
MEQLIVLQQAALASFLASAAPPQSVLLLLCAPCDLDATQLKGLSEYSSTIYWLCPEIEPLSFGYHADYDKWANLSVQCDRSFFWPV